MFLQTLLSVIYLIEPINQKPENYYFIIIILVKLANQYPSFSWARQTFSILKGTIINLLHLGVISYSGGGGGGGPSPLPLPQHAQDFENSLKILGIWMQENRLMCSHNH
jgi:hypothetical protein